MNIRIVEINASEIVDWKTFHEVFCEAFGFPEFYGRNMDAWIDCMTDLDDPDSGMTNLHVKKGGMVVLKILHADVFRERCREQFVALYECVGFVNYRRIDVGDLPILSLMLIGPFKQE